MPINLDTTTWMYIIGAVFVLLAVLALGRGRGQKVLGLNKTLFGTISLVLGGVLILGQMGVLTQVGISPFATTGVDSSSPQQTATNAGKTTLCAVEDTTVTLSAVNAFTQAAVGGTHRYSLNGAPSLTVADAGTFTASPGDSLEVLFFNESRTGAYYSSLKKEVVPCVGTATVKDKLYQNGTLTIDVFNRDGDLINGNLANQTVGAGDTFTLNARLTGAYQRGLPYGGIIVAEYNNSEFDDVIVNFGGERTSTPDFFTVSDTTHSAKAYTVSAILSNQEVSGTVYLDADDTVNPGFTNDVVLRFYPNNYFVNEDKSSAYELGVEDEDDVLSYQHITSFTAHIT